MKDQQLDQLLDRLETRISAYIDAELGDTLKAINERLDGITTQTNRLPAMERQLTDLTADVRTVREVVTSHSAELREHHHRLFPKRRSRRQEAA
jgi:uncharacterized protein involved in exopolysaccharide biosynthesis